MRSMLTTTILLTAIAAAPVGAAPPTVDDVRSAFHGMLEGWEREDVARATGVFTDDARVVAVAATYEGREGVEQWARETFEALSDIAIDVRAERVAIHGDVAWLTARIAFSAQHGDESIDDERHLTLVLLAQPDGSLRIPVFHASSAPGSSAAAPVTLSGLRFTPAAGWTSKEPSSRMRAAEFALPAPKDGASPASLVVYYFGPGSAGSVQANLDRWRGQFAPPDGMTLDDVSISGTRTVNGLTLHTLEVEGTFIAETRPGSGQRVNEPDSRMLAAIVETEAGPYYFKLVGRNDTVRHWRDGWNAMLASLAPASVGSGDDDLAHP